MSYWEEQDAREQAERDFERRGRYDSERYHDHFSREGLAYREAYDKAEREHRFMEDLRLDEQRQEERRQEARRRDLAIEAERMAEMERQAEEEEAPPADPLVEALEQVNMEAEEAQRIFDECEPT
jgi:hypothetical protein